MILYRCKITGDELFSDSFPMIEKENFFYEITGKNINISNEIDPSLIGGNESAETPSEGTADAVETKINVIFNHNLQPTQFDKKSYQAYIKGYIKKLLDKIKEEKGDEAAEDFKKRAGGGVKAILENFKNWEFYVGEKQESDGMVVLMDYREDGITPYFWYIKDGILEEKY